MFPMLPAAKDRFTLVPWQVVKAGDKVPTTDIVVAFETIDSSCKVTIEEVVVPQIFETTTLYFVPLAGSEVVVLVIFSSSSSIPW